MFKSDKSEETRLKSEQFEAKKTSETRKWFTAAPSWDGKGRSVYSCGANRMGGDISESHRK